MLAGAALLAASACMHREPPDPMRTAQPEDVQILRSYSFDTTVAEPQEQWNPESYQVLARSLGGFVLLEEGTGRQQYFTSSDHHDAFFPVWTSRTQFVFGPGHGMITTADQRIIPVSEGLTVVTLQQAQPGRDRAFTADNLTNSGYRPRVWNDLIVAQLEDRILTVDPYGTISEFGPGFFAEPQRHGPGICWQEFPVMTPDYWSGSTRHVGRLFIRWHPGLTTVLANAVEAQWTADGGLVATVLRSDPPAPERWLEAGTDVVYLAGPNAKPVVIAHDASAPAPHPRARFAAVVERSGGILLAAYDGAQQRELINQGERPSWSFDGRRLMYEAVAGMVSLPAGRDPLAPGLRPRIAIRSEGEHPDVHLAVLVLKIATADLAGNGDS